MTQAPTPAEDIATLTAEAETLHLPRFAEPEALQLGLILHDMAVKQGLAVVINIRTADRTLFHVATKGAAPLNDLWARRKSATALAFQKASLLVGAINRHAERSLSVHGLLQTDYADHGGAVPIVVTGVGMVAAVTVSGLPERKDHALSVQGLRALIAQLAQH